MLARGLLKYINLISLHVFWMYITLLYIVYIILNFVKFRYANYILYMCPLMEYGSMGVISFAISLPSLAKDGSSWWLRKTKSRKERNLLRRWAAWWTANSTSAQGKAYIRSYLLCCHRNDPHLQSHKEIELLRSKRTKWQMAMKIKDRQNWFYGWFYGWIFPRNLLRWSVTCQIPDYDGLIWFHFLVLASCIRNLYRNKPTTNSLFAMTATHLPYTQAITMVSKQAITQMDNSLRPYTFKIDRINPPWKSAEKQSSRCKILIFLQRMSHFLMTPYTQFTCVKSSIPRRRHRPQMTRTSSSLASSLRR